MNSAIEKLSIIVMSRWMQWMTDTNNERLQLTDVNVDAVDDQQTERKGTSLLMSR